MPDRTPTTTRLRAWIDDAETWAKSPREREVLAMRKGILAVMELDESKVEKLLTGMSSKRNSRATLIARLKRVRGYAKPVRGGTGKQTRTYRSVFKHAVHDQTTHGSWARGTSSEQLSSKTRIAGGTTVNPATGESPTSGFMVADPVFSKQVPKGQFSRETMKTYLRDNYHALRRANSYLGTWLDPDTGITWLDVAARYDGDDYAAEYEKAVRMGLDRGELAIFDLRTGTTIDLNDAESIRRHRLSLKEQK